MMKNGLPAAFFAVPLFLLLLLLPPLLGYALPAPAVEAGVEELRGVFLGQSAKAHLLSLQVGEKTLLLPYNSETAGLDEVWPGDNVMLRCRGAGEDRMTLEVEPAPVTIPAGVREIEIEELMTLITDPARVGKYLLIDCRPGDFYAKSHLPTSVSIPWTESREVKLAALPADREQQLIFYCLGSTCLLGPNSAALAVAAGYKHVAVLLVELSEWQESGGILYSADSYVTNGNVVLIDLRNLREAEAGHLPGAVNIPAGEISEAEYDFPVKKSAPVVLYGNGDEPLAAAATIKGWGFSQVSQVKGGYPGWVTRGNPVVRGRIPFKIEWHRRLDAGEVASEDFQKVLDGRDNGAVIVDVRTAEEQAKGSFAGALLIPLSELEARLAEIPGDKEIYLHCTTGARAQMAWTYLKERREKVRYLAAKVFSRNGRMMIKP